MLLVQSPVSRLASPAPTMSNLRETIPMLLEFLVYSFVLTLASTFVSGGWAWISQTWGVGYDPVVSSLVYYSLIERYDRLTLPDLTPNPGLWWYFFTEMFDHFRPFFLVVFSMHLLIYVLPVCIKFR